MKDHLTGHIDTLHFDEAWLPHAAFHDFYKNMHAIGEDRPRAKDTIVYSTQSIHKLLAGISQASQILVQDSKSKRFDHNLFNEAYLMHSSTSPQYSIIASLDVAAAMMEPPGGRALVEESIVEALDFRRAMNKVDGELGEDNWWFKVWGPEEIAADSDGMAQREHWILKPDDNWHGFDCLEPKFNMLDPIKSTIVTPGLSMNGEFDEHGIPASMVTRYLSEHGVIVEKTGLYSFFIMFTIGITKGRWNTLLAAIQQFKDDYDKNQPMWRVLPEFCANYPKYVKVGLKDLCKELHDTYKENDIAKLTTQMYLSDMEPAMKPADAFSSVSRRKTDRVPINELEGRITTSLLTPYPPGIPLLVPGERFNKTIVKYLKFARDFNKSFPGFEADIHGLVSKRNKSDALIQEVTSNGGMIGFSIYPHHLKNGTNCTLESFSTMIAHSAEKYGVNNLGIGSDLCQNQPDSVVEWMRNGTWSKEMDYGEGTKDSAGFPIQPEWFKKTSDFPNLLVGLKKVGFNREETSKIMGLNWLNFYEENFHAL